jgi:hypothetical protein
MGAWLQAQASPVPSFLFLVPPESRSIENYHKYDSAKKKKSLLFILKFKISLLFVLSIPQVILISLLMWQNKPNLTQISRAQPKPDPNIRRFWCLSG